MVLEDISVLLVYKYIRLLVYISVGTPPFPWGLNKCRFPGDCRMGAGLWTLAYCEACDHDATWHVLGSAGGSVGAVRALVVGGATIALERFEPRERWLMVDP